jgi:hypothetical protein
LSATGFDNCVSHTEKGRGCFWGKAAQIHTDNGF